MHTLPASPADELANGSSTPLELGILLDRSASMRPTSATTLKAFNSLLAEQKQLNPAARLTLLLFNDQCETAVDNNALAAVPDLTASRYQPDGGTAFVDPSQAATEPSEPWREQRDAATRLLQSSTWL
jgi:hypothetical protein